MTSQLRSETSQKSLLKIFCYNSKVTRKVKVFQKLSNKEIYLSLQPNGAKCNKPFKFISWQNFLEGHHILSPDICGKTFSHWLEMLCWIESYIFSIWYKLIYFSLPLNPAIHRMTNAQNILCTRCKEQEESQPHFIFYSSFPKLLWDFISELINLKYAFNISFKITLKTIIMGNSFQLHDGVELNILPSLSWDRNTAFELGSKETLVKAWSYLLNNNGNLNI